MSHRSFWRAPSGAPGGSCHAQRLPALQGPCAGQGNPRSSASCRSAARSHHPRRSQDPCSHIGPGGSLHHPKSNCCSPSSPLQNERALEFIQTPGLLQARLETTLSADGKAQARHHGRYCVVRAQSPQQLGSADLNMAFEYSRNPDLKSKRNAMRELGRYAWVAKKTLRARKHGVYNMRGGTGTRRAHPVRGSLEGGPSWCHHCQHEP